MIIVSCSSPVSLLFWGIFAFVHNIYTIPMLALRLIGSFCLFMILYKSDPAFGKRCNHASLHFYHPDLLPSCNIQKPDVLFKMILDNFSIILVLTLHYYCFLIFIMTLLVFLFVFRKPLIALSLFLTMF